VIGEPTDSPDGAEDDDAMSHEAQSESDFKGYVPATERTWIHPSEYSLASLTPSKKPHKRATAILGIAAALVVVVAGVSVFLSNRHAPPPTAALTAETSPQALPSAMKAALTSSVTISVTTHHVVEQMNGTMVAPNVIATTVALPKGSTVKVASPTGSPVRGTVVANDPTMNVSVIVMPQNLAQRSAIQATDAVMEKTENICDPNSGCRSVHVTNANQTLMSGQTPLSVIKTSPSGVGQAGDLLVSKSGAILGVSEPALGQNEFMPTWLFKQEALHLFTTKSAAHGYLGIDVADDAPKGAKVTALQSNSPAQGHLDVGDVVTAVDGQLVHSMAQFIDVLYSIPAKTPVDLGFTRHGQGLTTSVVLASSP
jgi:PDZ domain